jgi:hypothetical protein
MISPSERHLHFRSMRSSQALAQSVFAGLAALNRLNALAGILAEDGASAFFESAAGYEMKLEHKLSNLHEPNATAIDAFFFGPTKVAVEVKFAEYEFGPCSRPGLRAVDRHYERDHCDGTYTVQRNRKARCSLSERGIRYWEFIPRLFDWRGDQDRRPCPLDSTYQLARNVLAACVGEDDGVDIENGHALVIYDERNPDFSPDGRAEEQWQTTTRALRHPRVLRRVSWQRLARHLQQFHDLDWLTTALAEKYGIRGEVAA